MNRAGQNLHVKMLLSLEVATIKLKLIIIIIMSRYFYKGFPRLYNMLEGVLFLNKSKNTSGIKALVNIYHLLSR